MNGIANLRRQRIGHTCFRDIVEAVTARNFFKHIGNTNNTFANIKTMGRGCNTQTILCSFAFKLKMCE
jgi:hypothetical protein